MYRCHLIILFALIVLWNGAYFGSDSFPGMLSGTLFLHISLNIVLYSSSRYLLVGLIVPDYLPDGVAHPFS